MTLSVTDGTLAYEDTGSGPLIVCIPGMGDLRSQFRFLTPLLVASGYRVVALDLRGHGESSTHWKDYSIASIGADLLALLQRLDAGPAVIIANSMAAGSAVLAAVEGPQWVRGLVLLDPAVRGEPNRAWQLLLGVLFARPWGPAAWGRYYTSLYPGRKPADLENHLAAIRLNLQQPGRMEALQQLMIAPQTFAAANLGKAHVPALVIMGSRDPDFKQPEKEAGWVAQALDAQYQMVPGAGHYPHVEMPEITSPYILSFLSGLDRR
ncbi:predicted hydrolase [Longilinea arvoryzae]|uniref:Predicted hydrolase n=1 Tax=Longilinea arvoryzae TaxID=360412 RepID=A0A0S7B8S4_9CHLR|nr:alpha/beta hydrolase [Longilinea arvoryzae]GAP13919.1 predicted hydrolase [Longilinea arvoryzae]